MAVQFFGARTGCARAEEWVEHYVAGIGTGKDDAVQRRLGFLRRVRLCAVDFDALLAGTDRPVVFFKMRLYYSTLSLIVSTQPYGW